MKNIVNLDRELLVKAKECKTVEELITLAKENNVALTEEEAKEYYDRFNTSGELTDDELDNVAGGICEAGPCRCGCTKVVYQDIPADAVPL